MSIPYIKKHTCDKITFSKILPSSRNTKWLSYKKYQFTICISGAFTEGNHQGLVKSMQAMTQKSVTETALYNITVTKI